MNESEQNMYDNNQSADDDSLFYHNENGRVFQWASDGNWYNQDGEVVVDVDTDRLIEGKPPIIRDDTLGSTAENKPIVERYITPGMTGHTFREQDQHSNKRRWYVSTDSTVSPRVRISTKQKKLKLEEGMPVIFDLTVEHPDYDPDTPRFFADNVRFWEQQARQRKNFVPRNQSGGHQKGHLGRKRHGKRSKSRTKEERIRRGKRRRK